MSVEMKANDFKIKFGMDSHQIDVNILINNLMYISDLIHKINKELNTDKKIEVKIKALDKESFEIHLELVESFIKKSLFSKESIQYASGIIAILGSIYRFVKFLKGKRPKEIKEIHGDNIQVTNNNGDVTIFEKSVVNIYINNDQVRDSISKQFSSLQNSDDIKSFEIIDRNNNITHIDSEDFNILSNKMISETETKEPKITILSDEKLSIIRPSFSKDLKWDFLYKGIKINAKMEDENFLNRIDNGEDFSKGDLMVVEVEKTQFFDPEYNTYIITKNSYKILKFIDHIKNDKQAELF